MNCDIHVFIHDRTDRMALMQFSPTATGVGAGVQRPDHPPGFFPYLLTDGPARCFARGGWTSTSSGPSRYVAAHPAERRHPAPPTGGFWADLYDLRLSPATFDREFLAAARGCGPPVWVWSPRARSPFTLAAGDRRPAKNSRGSGTSTGCRPTSDGQLGAGQRATLLTIYGTARHFPGRDREDRCVLGGVTASSAPAAVPGDGSAAWW